MDISKNAVPVSRHGFHLIEKVLEELEQVGIAYCVMRNHQEILGSFPSGDVDILVTDKPRTFQRIKRLIDGLQESFGFSVYATGNHANVSRNIYLATSVDDVYYTINLEFFNQLFVYEHRSIKSKKYAYLDTNDVLKDRVKQGAIYSSSIHHEFVHKIVDSLFNHKPKYYSWLNREYSKIVNINKAPLNDACNQVLGNKAAEVVQSFDWLSDDKAKHQNLMDEILLFLKRNRELSFLKNLKRDLASLYQHTAQYVNPNGCFLLVLGTDGSGKTSICDAIESNRSRGFNKIHRIHLGNRPILLGSLKGQKISDPCNQLARSAKPNFHNYNLADDNISIYQSMRLIYTALDFVLHYWLVLRPFLARGDMILTERYFTDYVVIPERYFPSAPKWLKKLCYKFIPKPDVTVHISVSKEQIRERKLELPELLLDHELKQFKQYSEANCLPLVSNSGSFKNAVQHLEKIIFCRRVNK